MRKQTPQEKKKLSYERDTRNVYGEAPHAARKNIPLQKAKRNRANRRSVREVLAIELGTTSESVIHAIDSKLGKKAPNDWKKSPDAPLGEVVAEKSRKRKIMQEQGGRNALRTIVELNKSATSKCNKA